MGSSRCSESSAERTAQPDGVAFIIRWDRLKLPSIPVKEQLGSVRNQVAAIVPYGVAGAATAQIQVNYRGSDVAAGTVPVALSSPGIFTINSGTGQAAASNLIVNTVNQFVDRHREQEECNRILLDAIAGCKVAPRYPAAMLEVD
jgi:hypothetical protein